MALPSITIYGSIFSDPTRCVMIFCKLHNIAYDFVEVHLDKGEQKSPEFLLINPYGQVPAITHGTFSLGESCAILYYLAEAFGVDSQWLPANIQQRATINSNLHWHHNNTVKCVNPFIYEKVIEPKFFGKPPIATEREAEILGVLDNFLKPIDAIFANGIYIARTRHPTIADIMLYCYLSEMEMGNFDFSRYISIVRWREELDQIEAVRQVHEPMRQAIAQWS